MSGAELGQYLDDHAVTVGQACLPGWHVWLNSDDECVPLLGEFETEAKAENYAKEVRQILQLILNEYHEHLVDLGMVTTEQ